MVLDLWRRSGLPAGDFAPLVGVSRHTLYAWKKRFDTLGPARLMDKPRGRGPGSRLPELTRRTILMFKQSNPDFGCQRISDMLARGPALPASPSADPLRDRTDGRPLRLVVGHLLEHEPDRPLADLRRVLPAVHRTLADAHQSCGRPPA